MPRCPIAALAILALTLGIAGVGGLRAFAGAVIEDAPPQPSAIVQVAALLGDDDSPASGERGDPLPIEEFAGEEAGQIADATEPTEVASRMAGDIGPIPPLLPLGYASSRPARYRVTLIRGGPFDLGTELPYADPLTQSRELARRRREGRADDEDDGPVFAVDVEWSAVHWRWIVPRWLRLDPEESANLGTLHTEIELSEAGRGAFASGNQSLADPDGGAIRRDGAISPGAGPNCLTAKGGGEGIESKRMPESTLERIGLTISNAISIVKKIFGAVFDHGLRRELGLEC